MASSVVWLIGSPRTGSTWLLNLLNAHPRVRILDEPLIGAHLGAAASATVGVAPDRLGPGVPWRSIDFFADRDDYFFSPRYRSSWEPALRSMILTRFAAQLVANGGRPGRDRLVVKEPTGSEAADLLAALMPEARFLLLVRDGRDVIDSLLDALSQQAWASRLVTVADTPADRIAFAARSAGLWAERMRVGLDAVARIGEQRAIVLRYEDLLADPKAHLCRLFAWLELEVPSDLEHVVERLAFDKVPAEHRGSGRFHRSASPGSWRTNLTADEQAAMTADMATMLVRLGYDVA